MDALQAIHTRRSIRKYLTQPVPDELVEKIIAAGMQAPSAGNQQPWHFVVIRNREKLTAISQAHPHAHMAHYAATAILVCGNMQQAIQHPHFWEQDCAAATENILLALHALGLGGVWVGVHPRAERVADIRRIIPLPDHVVPFALIPLGYPAAAKGEENRFDRSRIHQEQW